MCVNSALCSKEKVRILYASLTTSDVHTPPHLQPYRRLDAKRSHLQNKILALDAAIHQQDSRLQHEYDERLQVLMTQNDVFNATKDTWVDFDFASAMVIA